LTMLQLEKLRDLCNSAHSGVTSVKKQVHLALEPSYLTNINLGILKCLNSHLLEYYPELSGTLLGYANIQLKKSPGSLYTDRDQPHLHINIQATFYIFCPSPATCLLGTVTRVSQGHVGVMVHGAFNASILKPAEVPVKSWAGSKLVVGKVVKFKVVSVSYNMNRPVLLGELDSLSMGVDERKVMVGVIEQVSDFERDSDHDSGSENGYKRKGKEIPTNTGATCDASGNKRKAEEVEDKGERKRRKKAEKKARKEKERQEREKQTLEASSIVDSSDEFQIASKLKMKKEKISEDSNFSSILKSDLKPPKTPSSKDKSHVAPKSPNTQKTPKDSFELPSNFKVIEHKTEKKSWKSYQGPDGKKFRSMTEVKKYLESTSNLVDTIEFVATEWNSTEHGDLDKTFSLEDLRDFPKSDLYFVDMKPKPAAEMASSDPPNVLEASAVETTDTNIYKDEELAESTKHEGDAISNKKKKKKKKDKSLNTSLE